VRCWPPSPRTARAPKRDDPTGLAAATAADAATVLAELADRDVIVFDGRGEIRAAYPFSPVPTPIQVRWAGGPVTYAMCVIDALGNCPVVACRSMHRHAWA